MLEFVSREGKCVSPFIYTILLWWILSFTDKLALPWKLILSLCILISSQWAFGHNVHVPGMLFSCTWRSLFQACVPFEIHHKCHFHEASSVARPFPNRVWRTAFPCRECQRTVLLPLLIRLSSSSAHIFSLCLAWAHLESNVCFLFYGISNILAMHRCFINMPMDKWIHLILFGTLNPGIVHELIIWTVQILPSLKT